MSKRRNDGNLANTALSHRHRKEDDSNAEPQYLAQVNIDPDGVK